MVQLLDGCRGGLHRWPILIYAVFLFLPQPTLNRGYDGIGSVLAPSADERLP